MITILFSVLLLSSESAEAAPVQPAPVAEQAPKAERKICKREMVSESRLGAKRVCLTAAQWKERESGSNN